MTNAPTPARMAEAMTDTTAGEGLTDIFENPFDFDDPRIEVARVLSRTEANAVLEFRGDIVNALAAQPSAGAEPVGYCSPEHLTRIKREAEARGEASSVLYGYATGTYRTPLYTHPAPVLTAGVADICERLDAILIEEDRMHPIGCASWEEEARVAIDMAKDAIRATEAQQ